MERLRYQNLSFRRSLLSVLVACVVVGMSGRAQCDECPLEDLAAAVDEVGTSLRTFNRDAMPTVTAKMRQLRIRKGWPEENFRGSAADYLHDTRIAGFDDKTNTLFAKIDALGPREDDRSVECARIADLRASGLELLAVMKAKAAYTISKIDSELAPAKVMPRAVAPAPVVPQAPKAAPKTDDSERLARVPGPWRTKTKRAGKKKKNAGIGYTIDEIRGATKGFFGTISTNLASVLEYAFKNSGRPTAYVLGNEGGGAFLAGVRYGKGTLYLRDGGRRKIYWHGPSVGSDIGASGSRTMFLIYDLEKADGIYRSFTGVDGSAYLVGGVGITYLQGGKVVMAPIRSGVGLRFGANLGYVRFTRSATWNPF